MNPNSLAGMKVLLTRPLVQQGSLRETIEAHAGEVVSMPLMKIYRLEHVDDIQSVKDKIQNLDNYHSLIFISTNAASYGAEWINRYWPQFPAAVNVIAIGPTTAQSVIDQIGCEVTLADTGMCSEDLLRLAVLQDVKGKSIAIIRGKGGRELLAESLRERGARIDYLEVYQRQSIHYDAQQFHRILLAEAVNVLTVSSGESLNSLLAALGDNKEEMSLLPLLVPSERIAQQARDVGFNRVVSAGGADAESFLLALESLEMG